MANITFEDYYPPERTDSVAWSQVMVYEGESSTGPWTLIDSIASTDWSPTGMDTDARHPASRTFTTDDATLSGGWYRIIWRDNGGGQSDPSESFQNGASAAAGIRPTVDELGAFMRPRTRAGTSGIVGTFTNVGDPPTNPTADQAEVMIDLAANIVLGTLGDIPARLRVSVRAVVLLLAAMYVEQQYYPDQIDNGQSNWDQLKELYDEQIAALERAVQGNAPGNRGAGIYSVPVYGVNGFKPEDSAFGPGDRRPAGGRYRSRYGRWAW